MKSYSTKETAVAIRAALKLAFPGQIFSVRTSYASMTSSTRIAWTDGPTSDEVERVTNNFSSKTFDGSDDSTHYHTQTVNDECVQYSGWVTTRRTVSASLLTKALARFQLIRAEYGLPMANITIQDGPYSAHVVGRDVNNEAGVSPYGYRFMFRYCSDAVESIAAQMRPNGCIVRMKS